MNYNVNNKQYSMNYQSLKETYEVFSGLTDEIFMKEMPNIIHFACIVSYLKGLKLDKTLSDEGIIHQLVHLLCGNDTSITVGEIREQFNTLLKLS